MPTTGRQPSPTSLPYASKVTPHLVTTARPAMSAQEAREAGCRVHQGAGQAPGVGQHKVGLAGAAGPSALAVRAWRREAQRRVRLALTGMKTCLSQYAEEADAGQAVLSKLCDVLLAWTYLPAQALGPLSTQQPCVRTAAAAKLLRQASSLAAQLLRCCEQLQVLAQQCQAHAQGGGGIAAVAVAASAAAAVPASPTAAAGAAHASSALLSNTMITAGMAAGSHEATAAGHARDPAIEKQAAGMQMSTPPGLPLAAPDCELSPSASGQLGAEQLGPGLPLSLQLEPWQQQDVEVLAGCLTLPAALHLLQQQVAVPLALDAQDKRAVAMALARVAVGAGAAVEGQAPLEAPNVSFWVEAGEEDGANQSQRRSPGLPGLPQLVGDTAHLGSFAALQLSSDRLAERCLVWQAVWLLSPRREPAREQSALEVVTLALAATS
ncbi:hypothetical protein V8C86DRAFT_1220754 [Haematococcus lacustris]